MSRSVRPGSPPLPGTKLTVATVLAAWFTLVVLSAAGGAFVTSPGTLASGLVAGVATEITTGPMAQLPLVLVPAYFVPIFIMLHMAALFQARRLARHLRERA